MPETNKIFVISKYGYQDSYTLLAYRFHTRLHVTEKSHVSSYCTISLSTTESLTHCSIETWKASLFIDLVVANSCTASSINGNALWSWSLHRRHAQYNFVHFSMRCFEKPSCLVLISHLTMTRQHTANSNYMHLTESGLKQVLCMPLTVNICLITMGT